MKISISVTGDVDGIELDISVNGKSVAHEQGAQPAEEQREVQLDALVHSGDSREPRELDVRHRGDSYGFIDDPDQQKRKQTIGFSRS
ncbi:hypothetical protein SEA_EASTWEST_56 [Arthrobacter phage EastWest]|uniref:Uncharacterized protein n=1 Tax=Arthrobacter phage EastWest TaxID=2894292 RepID=A0AAE8YKI2_9CAUD|nr:hypothetical protein SEA_EASTWEST_56 [Arthrobacter phage EastWest]